MTFDEFVGEVQHRARLGSLGEAVRAIRCTLGVLSQRLAGGEVQDLASQLPEEIGFYLLHVEAGRGRRFSADEFLDRVSACEREDKPDAIFHVRAVLEVLREAISAGEFEHVLDQLPGGFEPLFAASSEGKMQLNSRKQAARAPTRRQVAIPGGRVTRGQPEDTAQAERPRSARIAKRAAGAWHLGR